MSVQFFLANSLTWETFWRDSLRKWDRLIDGTSWRLWKCEDTCYWTGFRLLCCQLSSFKAVKHALMKVYELSKSTKGNTFSQSFFWLTSPHISSSQSSPYCSDNELIYSCVRVRQERRGVSQYKKVRLTFHPVIQSETLVGKV